MKFETDYTKIDSLIDNIDPNNYGRTRNYIDGAVTYLSPYISRGVISTKFVLNKILSKGFDPRKIEKFIQELAWRDYWQLTWNNNGELIDQDLKHQQQNIANNKIPTSIIKAQTGIDAIDKAIKDLYNNGYMHNHVRMYVASIACNIGKSHWSLPAKWMYYYLLDADWASNALSWQWIAGSNSKKKYYANQNNVNKFCYTNQKNTFLDKTYEELMLMEIPVELREISDLSMKTSLPESTEVLIDPNLPTLIYNFYNLDPTWFANIKANRILLLEPAIFDKYPISPNTLNFILELSKNIDSIQIFVGEFDDFVKDERIKDVYFKQHPLNKYYVGHEESRDWMFNANGEFSSFFSFWNKCKKEFTLELF